MLASACRESPAISGEDRRAGRFDLGSGKCSSVFKSHEKFHSAHGKRLVLVADDEVVNRELMGLTLQEDYEVIYACDGQETVDQVRRYKDDLSLVLLDLMMPVKPGLEALREMKADPELKHIPVIVITADQDAEIESLRIGAVDYIPKPYPQAGIILARILKAIELYEDRDIIQSTERDPLTGLYNREYFYRYSEQYDQHHRDMEMDCIVVDVNHFHMINERFGTAYGDEILRRIGEKIREMVADTDGIVCRRSADTFMVYCPHGKDYKAILENASIGLSGDESVNSRVRLRMGVYAKADKTLEIERRFDRAKMAADTVRNSFTRTIGIYDGTMHERELYTEQLIDDFHKALDEKQFTVFFQPKFDVRPKTPVLSSAEALVRWRHPELGMISPGVFIPLFEDNGLIQELDNYVWRETAAHIRDWKDRLGFSVPVSVNVSRIDMYDPDLMTKLWRILDDNGLKAEDLLLEITESAYTQDSEQIIETVNQLRELGFRIEMDDFGTGYSSLNMISSMPIDALKLDMQFVRSAFKDQKDTRMLEVIIDISDRLGVPVIAEGVETEEQVVALKDLGCDIIQGYYFSKPVPAEDFEPFLEERKVLPPEALIPEVKETPDEEASALSGEPKQRKPIHLRATNYIFASLAMLLALAVIVSNSMISRGYERMGEASARYDAAQHAAMELESGSDYLTDAVRSFVVTGDLRYLNDYFEEATVTRRRDNAVELLQELLTDSDSSAFASLAQALETSNALMEKEYLAMRLVQTASGIPDSDIPAEISGVRLDAGQRALSPEEKKTLAEQLVFGDEYLGYKLTIWQSVDACTDQLIEKAAYSVEENQDAMERILRAQTVLLIVLILTVLAEVVFITVQVRIPLTRMVEQMRSQEKVNPRGAAELHFVTNTYNEILEENKKAQRELSYEATHDPLTGLLNRSAYELFMAQADIDHIGLLIIDVDDFKAVNDTYGHDMGDRILKHIAGLLTQSFRSVDAICRVGGDEFVVVMTRANSSMRQLVINMIAKANHILQHPQGNLPKVSLSVGVAFSDREDPQGDIFKDADTALYRVKSSGRCGCEVYGAPSEETNA